MGVGGGWRGCDWVMLMSRQGMADMLRLALNCEVQSRLHWQQTTYCCAFPAGGC